MSFLLIQAHMWLEISKSYSSRTFHVISAKLYEGIAYYGGCRPLLFLEIWPAVKITVAFWNFHMGVNGKSAISWKRLLVERNGWKSETHGARTCICRVLFMSDSLSSGWGHSVHLAKLLLAISKGYYSHSFSPFQPNFMAGMAIWGWGGGVGWGWMLLFWRSAKLQKNIWHFEIFVNTWPAHDHMLVEISLRYASYNFYAISAILC